MKGENSTYRPAAGTRCLLSGSNMDDDKGYVFVETTILWSNAMFVLYGIDGCWPVINKWDHILAKPIDTIAIQTDQQVAEQLRQRVQEACVLVTALNGREYSVNINFKETDAGEAFARVMIHKTVTL